MKTESLNTHNPQRYLHLSTRVNVSIRARYLQPQETHWVELLSRGVDGQVVDGQQQRVSAEAEIETEDGGTVRGILLPNPNEGEVQLVNEDLQDYLIFRRGGIMAIRRDPAM